MLVTGIILGIGISGIIALVIGAIVESKNNKKKERKEYEKAIDERFSNAFEKIDMHRMKMSGYDHQISCLEMCVNKLEKALRERGIEV